MKRLILSALLVAAPLTAVQAMNVATFLQKAEALQRKGIGAMFSSDIGLLKGEIKDASAALRVERLAAEHAGRHGAYCPPARFKLGSDEILASFRAVPPAQRERTQVKDALRGLFARKFPCRG